MKIESFIAGAILGTAFSNPHNQRLLLGMMQKAMSLTVDSLNKRGGLNAPAAKPTEPVQQPLQQDGDIVNPS